MGKFLKFLLLALLLAACQTIETVPAAPNLAQPYILVTANPRPSLTPFQPPLFTPTLLPSLPPPSPSSTGPAAPHPSETPRPSSTGATVPSLSSSNAAVPRPNNETPPSETPSPNGAGGAMLRPFYNLNIDWDYAAHSLTVMEEITYPNQTGQTLDSLPLIINPNLWNGVFSLTSLSLNDQPVSDYNLNGQTLTLPLAAPLSEGQAIRIDLTYGLTLPYSSSKLENFGWTGRQSNLIDWFPFVPPFLPETGWLMREPWVYGENLAYPLADFLVGLTFTDETAPIVAASALPVAGVYSLPQARTFTLSASPEFQVTSAEQDGITFLSYYFAENAAAGQAALAFTQSAAHTYAQFYGAYPHTSLSVVETDLNDGLESDGLYFLARNFYASYDGSGANNLTLIGVHETAHQWFFGLISNDQALEPWLDEALATYSEHIYYQNNLPGLLNWWTNARIYAYAPSGYVDTRLYNTPNFRAYVDAVYLRGALFLDALRTRMGDPAFFAFLRDYVDRHRGHLATADTFFSVLADHTNQVDDLIHSFFYYR